LFCFSLPPASAELNAITDTHIEHATTQTAVAHDTIGDFTANTQIKEIHQGPQFLPSYRVTKWRKSPLTPPTTATTPAPPAPTTNGLPDWG